jgi:hypothetical protein
MQLIGTCGRARRHAVRIVTMCSRITGTGSESTVQVKHSITARTRLMSAAGRWVSTIRTVSAGQVADTSSKTTGNSMTR